MKFKEKIILLIILFAIVLFMDSCAGAPAADEGEVTAVTVKENTETAEKKVEYKTEIVDFYVEKVEKYFLDDQSENGYKLFTYNDKGLMTSMESFKGSGDLLFKETYTLDEKGRVVRSDLYDNEGLTSYVLYKYDENDNPVEEEYYNHEDVYISGSTYEYNNAGLKTLWVSLDENKSPLLKSEYISSGGNLTKIAFMTPLNREDGFLLYTYEGGKLVREVSTGSNGKEERKTEYEYDGDRLIREKLFQLGRLSRTNEYSYDGNGNISLMTTFNRAGKLLNTTEYEYLTFQKEIQVLVK